MSLKYRVEYNRFKNLVAFFYEIGCSVTFIEKHNVSFEKPEKGPNIASQYDI
jgi:hypothetical protein